ncbi:VanZ family protein [Niallia taxi]|uniref:VanZ family protein n=1 Tax=Niallia taxi TaxID=2499688 RepID=A0A437K5Z1_9BACI|nr:VanZ family protein [Niallia taxi]RVT58547.1 VanZ family protein [Niallia taxi]
MKVYIPKKIILLAFLTLLFIIWIQTDIELALNFPIILLLLVPMWVYYRIYRSKKKQVVDAKREFLVNIFFLYLLMVMYVTLTPFHFTPSGNRGNINLVPYVQILYQYENKPSIFWMLYTLGNIIMFIPFGLLVPAIYRRRFKWLVTIFLGAFASLTIEVTQYFFTVERAADIDDFILNVFGSLLGYFLYRFTKILKNKYPENIQTNQGLTKK